MKLKYFIVAIVGIVCGLLSTYPIELKFLPAIILWGAAGIVLGFFSQGKRGVLWSGILYGISLCIAFLFSRFGGTAHQLPSYVLFVALASIGSIGGALLSIFIGSKLRALVKPNVS